MKQSIEVFGGNGQHGSDLIHNRGVFKGINIEIIGDKQTTPSQESKAIIIPISGTSQTIEKIMQSGQITGISNFAGIMSTTPEAIRGNDGIENFHFLFGPKTTSNLKCVLAFETTLSPLGNKIVENSKSNSIKIIESSIEQHDKKMALIQGLNHLTRQLLLHSNIQTDLPIINTTLQTVQDMILLNPYMNGIMMNLNNMLCTNEMDLSIFFNQLIEENLTHTEIENFSTPAFIDTLNFIRKNQVILKSKNIGEYLKTLKI